MIVSGAALLISFGMGVLLTIGVGAWYHNRLSVKYLRAVSEEVRADDIKV